MFSKSVQLVCGSLLLLFGTYISLSSFNAWKPFWQQREAALIHPAATVSPNAAALGPELADVPTVKVYGPLASAAAKSAHDNDGVFDAPTTSDPNAVPIAPVPSGRVSPLDHIAGVVASVAQPLVNQLFSVKNYQAFAFVVPPHTLHARVAGQFQTISTGNAGQIVDVLLMKEKDYQEFAQHHPSDTAFSQTDSRGGSVGWTLPATLLDPQKYYLVFANSNETGGQTFVNADFTVSFE